MLKLKNLALLLVLGLLISVSSVLAQDGTIVDVAAGDENFSTLVELVTAAGLADTLAGEGPYTVFAPTNEAFAALPPFVVDYLISHPDVLTRVLTYHVISGSVMSTDLTASMMAPSMEMAAVGGEMTGSELTVEVNDMGITVDGAHVVTPDLAASNGVIHAIDAVLIPPMELPAVDPLAISGDIIAAGSSTVYPLTERMADNFEADGFAGSVTVDSIGTGGGGERFCINVETDIWNASRPANEEELAACAGNGRTVAEFYVAIDALAIVVSTENDFLEELTVEQLGAIFSGTAATWADIDPSFPAEPIRLFSPGNDSGTYDYFVEEVFDEDETQIQNAPGIQFSEDDNVLVQGILGSPYAIGYFGFAYYQENQETLKPVAIEGVIPSEQTGLTGEYPLSRPLFIYSALEVLAEKPQVSAFINYYLQNANSQLGTADGQIGYIPTNPFVGRYNALVFLAATAGMMDM